MGIRAEYKDLVNDCDVADDYMPEPYKSKWLFCNHCGSEQAAGANDR